jgi:hypothetical protein
LGSLEPLRSRLFFYVSAEETLLLDHLPNFIGGLFFNDGS